MIREIACAALELNTKSRAAYLDHLLLRQECDKNCVSFGTLLDSRNCSSAVEDVKLEPSKCLPALSSTVESGTPRKILCLVTLSGKSTRREPCADPGMTPD